MKQCVVIYFICELPSVIAQCPELWSMLSRLTKRKAHNVICLPQEM